MTPAGTLRKRFFCCLISGILLIILNSSLFGLTPPPYEDPEDLVRELYQKVSFEAGSTPNWDEVKSMFIDQAVITLRTSRTAMSIFSLEGFVGDFVAFIERAKADEIGFQEKVLALQKTIFGETANFQVLYSAQLMQGNRPPTKGIDNFLLIKQADGWKIAAITNEIVTPDRPIPEGLQH